MLFTFSSFAKKYSLDFCLMNGILVDSGWSAWILAKFVARHGILVDSAIFKIDDIWRFCWFCRFYGRMRVTSFWKSPEITFHKHSGGGIGDRSFVAFINESAPKFVAGYFGKFGWTTISPTLRGAADSSIDYARHTSGRTALEAVPSEQFLVLCCIN